MRHQITGRKLGRHVGHRLLLYRNLVTDLLKYEKIVTTDAKAREIRKLADKVITMGKDGSLPARRRALAFIIDEKIVDKLFTQIAPRYKERPGGYTRLYKLGPRPGDGAPTIQIELVK